MTPEKQKQLYDKYPKIFVQKGSPPTETCMCWGISTGDGWYEILDRLCGQLQWLSDKTGIQIDATQVKEKYATLRFYWLARGDNNDTMALDIADCCVSTAERQSGYICEECGRPGSLRGKHWVSTRCDACAKEPRSDD